MSDSINRYSFGLANGFRDFSDGILDDKPETLVVGGTPFFWKPIVGSRTFAYVPRFGYAEACSTIATKTHELFHNGAGFPTTDWFSHYEWLGKPYPEGAYRCHFMKALERDYPLRTEQSPSERRVADIVGDAIIECALLRFPGEEQWFRERPHLFRQARKFSGYNPDRPDTRIRPHNERRKKVPANDRFMYHLCALKGYYEVDEIAESFGSVPLMLISAAIGGGIWNERYGKMLLRRVIFDEDPVYREFYSRISASLAMPGEDRLHAGAVHSPEEANQRIIDLANRQLQRATGSLGAFSRRPRITDITELRPLELFDILSESLLLRSELDQRHLWPTTEGVARELGLSRWYDRGSKEVRLIPDMLALAIPSVPVTFPEQPEPKPLTLGRRGTGGYIGRRISVAESDTSASSNTLAVREAGRIVGGSTADAEEPYVVGLRLGLLMRRLRRAIEREVDEALLKCLRIALDHTEEKLTGVQLSLREADVDFIRSGHLEGSDDGNGTERCSWASDYDLYGIEFHRPSRFENFKVEEVEAFLVSRSDFDPNGPVFNALKEWLPEFDARLKMRAAAWRQAILEELTTMLKAVEDLLEEEDGGLVSRFLRAAIRVSCSEQPTIEAFQRCYEHYSAQNDTLIESLADKVEAYCLRNNVCCDNQKIFWFLHNGMNPPTASEYLLQSLHRMQHIVLLAETDVLEGEVSKEFDRVFLDLLRELVVDMHQLSRFLVIDPEVKDCFVELIGSFAPQKEYGRSHLRQIGELLIEYPSAESSDLLLYVALRLSSASKEVSRATELIWAEDVTKIEGAAYLMAAGIESRESNNDIYVAGDLPALKRVLKGLIDIPGAVRAGVICKADPDRKHVAPLYFEKGDDGRIMILVSDSTDRFLGTPFHKTLLELLEESNVEATIYSHTFVYGLNRARQIDFFSCFTFAREDLSICFSMERGEVFDRIREQKENALVLSSQSGLVASVDLYDLPDPRFNRLIQSVQIPSSHAMVTTEERREYECSWFADSNCGHLASVAAIANYAEARFRATDQLVDLAEKGIDAVAEVRRAGERLITRSSFDFRRREVCELPVLHMATHEGKKRVTTVFNAPFYEAVVDTSQIDYGLHFRFWYGTFLPFLGMRNTRFKKPCDHDSAAESISSVALLIKHAAIEMACEAYPEGVGFYRLDKAYALLPSNGDFKDLRDWRQRSSDRLLRFENETEELRLYWEEWETEFESNSHCGSIFEFVDGRKSVSLNDADPTNGDILLYLTYLKGYCIELHQRFYNLPSLVVSAKIGGGLWDNALGRKLLKTVFDKEPDARALYESLGDVTFRSINDEEAPCVVPDEVNVTLKDMSLRQIAQAGSSFHPNSSLNLTSWVNQRGPFAALQFSDFRRNPSVSSDEDERYP